MEGSSALLYPEDTLDPEKLKLMSEISEPAEFASADPILRSEMYVLSATST